MRATGSHERFRKAIYVIVLSDGLVFLLFFAILLRVLRNIQAAILVGIGAAALYLPLICMAVIAYTRRKMAKS